MRTNSLQDTDESFVKRRLQFDRSRCFRCHEHHELHLPAIDDKMHIGGIRIQTLLLFGHLRSKCHYHFCMCLTNNEAAPLYCKKSKRFEVSEKKVRVSHAIRIYAAELKATRYFCSLEHFASRGKSSLTKCLIH